MCAKGVGNARFWVLGTGGGLARSLVEKAIDVELRECQWSLDEFPRGSHEPVTLPGLSAFAIPSKLRIDGNDGLSPSSEAVECEDLGERDGESGRAKDGNDDVRLSYEVGRGRDRDDGAWWYMAYGPGKMSEV